MSWIVLPNGKRLGTGDRVHLKGFLAKPLGTYSIAGAQPKVTGNWIDALGEVRHVRGNHPSAPTRIWVNLKVDDDTAPNGACEVVDCAKCGGIKEHSFELYEGLGIEFLVPQEPSNG